MTHKHHRSQDMADNLHHTAIIPPLAPPDIPPSEPGAVPAVHAGTMYVTEPLRWQYRVLTCDLEHGTLLQTDQLNALGAEGWELAGVVAHIQHAYFYFKRCLS